MTTLDDFAPQEPCNDVQRCNDPACEESVPLDASVPVIRNWPLVVMVIREAFTKDNRVVLLLDSNGSPDKKATEW